MPHRLPTPEYIANLSPDLRDRIVETCAVLGAAPHGPGQVGLVAMDPRTDESRLLWLPTDSMIDLLRDLDRPKWIPQLRTCPTNIAPVVIILPDGDFILSALVGNAVHAMSSGSAVLS